MLPYNFYFVKREPTDFHVATLHKRRRHSLNYFGDT